MSENRQMEKKLNMPVSKSAQGNKNENKKSTEVSISKFATNRRNGKLFSVQPQKSDGNRGVSFKKNNNFKQPQPRVSLFCGKKSAEVIDTLQDVEDEEDANMLPNSRQWNQTNMWNMPKKHSCSLQKTEEYVKFNIKHFLLANCQFVVKSGRDYTFWIFNQDEIVNWDYIEQIKMLSTQAIKCPICMDIPTTPKITCCGHIYCWPCILRYLDVNKEFDIDTCPICHSTVIKNELKSFELILNEECRVGHPITLQLMKRARNSLQAYPFIDLQKNNNHSSGNLPLSISELNMSTTYSRLLVANKNEILTILNKEREALVLLLDHWETEDKEKKYIFEALELLSKREDLIMNEKLVSNGIKKSINAPGCSHNLSPSPNKNNSNSSEIEKNHDYKGNYINVDCVQSSTSKPTKKDFYFYQAIDGQHIYLSAINIEMLEKMYGSLENSPQKLTAIVYEKQYLSMTESLRKRYRFLLHLPISTVFEWVEIDMVEIVSPEIFDLFKSNLDDRKIKRDRRAYEEQRLTKRIEERNQKKQIPPPEWKNWHIFPQCGYDPFSDESMVSLNESLGTVKSSSPTNISQTTPSLSNLSFAKALQNKNSLPIKTSTAIQTSSSSIEWPTLMSTSKATSIKEQKLEETIANLTLNGNGSNKINKKKKRSKYEPLN
ncbi:RING finger protein 10 [Daktulosphaira vitifoliae]|uniref:RING finger protein 10 n=1 Tax=Daktulosphaira vitifoliae TaxID=58002 RepID=UPI0021AAA105|nr:RING finger protein 10 [Daktulosphaira vitifoliae]